MKKILISVFALAALAGCQKEPKVNTTPLGDVTTLQANNIHDTRAQLNGQLNIPVGRVTDFGFIFSDTPIAAGTEGSLDKLSAIGYASIDNTTEIFSYTVENLTNTAPDGSVTGKSYYYKAYMTTSSGTVYGGQIIFRTLPVSISDPSAPGTAAPPVPGARSVQATFIMDPDLGTAGSAPGFTPIITLLPAQIGYYVWKADADGNPIGDPVRFQSPDTEQQVNIYTGSWSGTDFTPAPVDITITGLLPGTNYSIAPFAVVGAYFSITAPPPYPPTNSYMTSYSNEVVGDHVPVTTSPVDLPTVETADTLAEDVTATSIIMRGTLTGNGGDEFCQVGFKWGTTGDTTKMDKPVWVDPINPDNTFSSLKRLLTPNTTYYYVAVAYNYAGMTYGEVKAFTTNGVEPPVIGDVAPMEYAYRVDNTTTTSAKIRASIMSDGGESLSEYGIMFSTDGTTFSQKTYTTAIDKTTGLFYVKVDGLKAGTEYYYYVYARNSAGRVDDNTHVLSFRTPLGGILLYVYPANVFKNNPSVWARVAQFTNGPMYYSLTYYETDPIKGTLGTYYFLDRNLGATAPFTKYRYALPNVASGPQKPVVGDTTGITAQLQYLGYYYQHGCPAPSATPDMTQTGALNSLYGWTNAPANPTAPAYGADLLWPSGTGVNYFGVPYPSNPCPDGYDIPTSAQMNDVIGAMNHALLPGWFDAIRLGVTGEKAPGNGNLTAAGLRISEANFWLKDATSATNVKVFHVGLGVPPTITDTRPATATAAAPSTTRYYGETVRCVRVEIP